MSLISNNYGYILKSHLAIIAVLHCGLHFLKEMEKVMIFVGFSGEQQGRCNFLLNDCNVLDYIPSAGKSLLMTL